MKPAHKLSSSTAECTTCYAAPDDAARVCITNMIELKMTCRSCQKSIIPKRKREVEGAEQESRRPLTCRRPGRLSELSAGTGTFMMKACRASPSRPRGALHAFPVCNFGLLRRNRCAESVEKYISHTFYAHIANWTEK